jgi:glycosyltransferase involved in cell wall biosynthesis
VSTPAEPAGVLLDLQPLQSATSRNRGIARWTSGFAGGLAGLDSRLRRALLDPGRPRPAALPAGVPDSLAAWNTAAEVRAAASEGPSVYCLTSPFEFVTPAASLLPAHVMEGGIPIVAVLYDLIPLQRRRTYLDDPGMARRYDQRLELLRRADLVLAISEHTRRTGIDLLGLDPRRIAAVGTGVDAFFRPAPPGDEPAARLRTALPAIDRPFVLTVSAADERKNTETLIDAYAALPPSLRSRHRLVVACGLLEDTEARWRRRAAAAGLSRDELVLTDLVDDSLLRDLYRSCAVFAFPSRDEGFGLPVAEAMACGAPALTSNASSLPEVLDRPEATFDPDDAASLSALLERTLADEAYAADLRRAGAERAAVHSWPAVAARAVAAIDGGLGHEARSAVSVRRPLRVALCGPVPPVRSGIAVYNARVADELARLCRLDVLTPAGIGHGLAATLNGVGRFPLDALGRVLDPAAYDAIVYTLGNNEDHVETVAALRRVPGIAWLHDVRLPILATALRMQPGVRGAAPWAWVAADLAARGARPLMPEELPPPPWRGPSRPSDLAAVIAASCRAVLVNAPAAARLLVDDGPSAEWPPIRSLGGIAVPDLTGDADRDDPPLVVSMGIVDPVKAPEALIEALPEIRRRTGAHVALVGLVGEEHAVALRGQARRLGVGDALTITGHVDSDDYRRWLLRASVAVQLRLRSNGESSAAIADCIGAGVPVVTDMAGADEEWPGDAIVHLRPGTPPRELAEAVCNVLEHADEWERRHLAALSLAAGRGFDALARELLATIEDLGVTAPLRGWAAG